jgi:Putative MetA-pathway of phenol degradation
LQVPNDFKEESMTEQVGPSVPSQSILQRFVFPGVFVFTATVSRKVISASTIWISAIGALLLFANSVVGVTKPQKKRAASGQETPPELLPAGAPFATDDTEPPTTGGWEINVPFILERTPGTTDMDAPLFDLNYGLLGIQLKLAVPVKIVHEDSSGTVAGIGDTLIGVKWRFFNSKESQLELAISPQLLVPSGDHARGLGEGGTAFTLPLAAQKTWDKWTLYGNVGFWWRTGAETRNYFYASAVLEREISKRLTLGVELFGNSPTEPGGDSDVGFNVGGSWKLRKHVNVLFTAGRDIVGDKTALAYIGLQFLTK